MKLQLTIFAQDLSGFEEEGEGAGCNPFAVVASGDPGAKPKLVGKTEVLKNTLDPDFTKIFVLDYDLGQKTSILVTLHDANHSNRKIDAAVFDVGTVLGTKGGVLGKQLKSGGYLMVHVEKSSGKGTLNLKLRGLDLVSQQDQVDPYFELQKKRKTVDGKTIWDVVFRSMPAQDTTDPIWTEISIDYGALCDGKKKRKFRISVKDYDDSDDTLIGSCFVTVDQLLKLVVEGGNSSGLKDEIQTDKVIPLMRPRPLRQVGKLLVAAAYISDDDSATEDEDIAVEYEYEDTPTSRGVSVEEEEDIIFEPEGDIIIAPDEVDPPSFSDYISGGCQLRAIVAIDYTASNGDPRKEESLHHFAKTGMNAYEESIKNICSVLAEYDSDQQYPVYGFGAKKDGELNHCFVVGDEKKVHGVDGILAAYKNAFKSGIAMSKPTDITEVIKTAGSDALECLGKSLKDGRQEYTILVVFTNGGVHSVEETISALDGVKDKPLSIVVVGVGPSADMTFLNEIDGGTSHVVFVDAKAEASEALKHIPEDLVRCFTKSGIRPNPPIEPDEIVIEPFTEESEVQVGVNVSENGEISIGNETDSNTAQDPPSSEGMKVPEPVAAIGGKGKKIFLAQAKRQFGRISRTMERNMNRMIDKKVNKMFGIPNATQTGRRKNNRKKK